MNVTYITNTRHGEDLLAKRLDKSCGWIDCPHVVFMGGWLCMGCGQDIRGAGNTTVTDDDGWDDATGWSGSGSGWKFTGTTFGATGEPSPDPDCRCGSKPEDWFEWGGLTVCTICDCEIDSDRLAEQTAIAMLEDPEYLDCAPVVNTDTSPVSH